MIPIIMYLISLFCTIPAPHSPGPQCNGIHIIMTTNGGGGGETGNPPPPPPPPPPPGG